MDRSIEGAERRDSIFVVGFFCVLFFDHLSASCFLFSFLTSIGKWTRYCYYFFSIWMWDFLETKDVSGIMRVFNARFGIHPL